MMHTRGSDLLKGPVKVPSRAPSTSATVRFLQSESDNSASRQRIMEMMHTRGSDLLKGPVKVPSRAPSTSATVRFLQSESDNSASRQRILEMMHTRGSGKYSQDGAQDLLKGPDSEDESDDTPTWSEGFHS
mmetsp:Transcript_2586/g.5463  ORF Transcript_2586/g.5463 Transcript_2586/m.5463 type:complete len:131 (-) Transcript_2586:205-597(-)